MCIYVSMSCDESLSAGECENYLTLVSLYLFFYFFRNVFTKVTEPQYKKIRITLQISHRGEIVDYKRLNTEI